MLMQAGTRPDRNIFDERWLAPDAAPRERSSDIETMDALVYD
jgi:hypothetical protein